MTGPRGPTTRTETFVLTTYSQFKDASSTITTKTVVTVQNEGPSSSVSTYSYEIGPGGVGWRLPSFSNGALSPLPLPTFLPGEKPSAGSSSRVTSTASSTAHTATAHTSSTSVVSSRTGSNSNGPSTKSSYSDSTSSTNRQEESTSSQTSSKASKSESSQSLSQTSSTSTKRPSPGSTTSMTIPSSRSSSASSSNTASTDTESVSKSSTSESEADPTSRVSGPSSTKASGNGPAITSSTAVITGTITQAPTGFSAETVSGTTYPSNTWITTKDDDDHTTIVPVIILRGGPPIIMWGLPPTPNVQFGFPKLPKFHLPCVKVFGVSVGSCTTDPVTDGPPEEDKPDDPTETDKTTEKTSTTKKSTTTDECSSTSTVSACEVRCAKTTSSNSCASYSTTCSETKTGCSVTGTITTITSSTSSCSSCGSCMTRGPAGNGGPPAPTQPPIRPDDEEEGASDLRKRDHPRHLQKRAGSASEVKTLGACALASGTVAKLTRPPWPRATADILKPDAQNKMQPKWSVISRYDRATGTGPCGTVPTVTRLDAQAFQIASNYQGLDGKPKPDNDRLSLDHACKYQYLLE